MTLTREGGEGRGERGGGKAGEQFKILILVPLHGGGGGGCKKILATIHFNILSCDSDFLYFICRQYLLPGTGVPFISTSYQLFHILDILLADNICNRSFQHPTNCFIFWIFYLPTIFATLCNHVSHIFEILLADNICYRSL